MIGDENLSPNLSWETRNRAICPGQLYLRKHRFSVCAGTGRQDRFFCPGQVGTDRVFVLVNLSRTGRGQVFARLSMRPVPSPLYKRGDSPRAQHRTCEVTPPHRGCDWCNETWNRKQESHAHL